MQQRHATVEPGRHRCDAGSLEMDRAELANSAGGARLVLGRQAGGPGYGQYGCYQNGDAAVHRGPPEGCTPKLEPEPRPASRSLDTQPTGCISWMRQPARHKRPAQTRITTHG